MLMKLDLSWLMMAIATVAMLSYMLSLGLDALMKGDGFGPLGNAILIGGGFFLTILLGNTYGVRFRTLPEATLIGLGGAFSAFIVLTFIKAVLNRM